MADGRKLRPLAVTSGEPAGIGPDICLALAQAHCAAPLVVLGDKNLLSARAAQLGCSVALRDYAGPAENAADQAAGGDRAPEAECETAAECELEVLHIPARAPCRAGVLETANSAYVLALLDRAMRGCMAGEFSAMVTAPVQKSIINDAGFPFSGHTEYLAGKAGCERVVMMLAGGGMRVALATTHLALRDVPDAITPELLDKTLRIIIADLKARFGLPAPRIVVAGLNPHAGEHGYLGSEDDGIIAPVVARLKSEGHDVAGPLPADTLFVPSRLQTVDCVLAMYHDQGLPVLKYASFGGGVNITLGLPFIRTSVDHGTALDLAGSGRADPGSLVAAVQMAVDMVQRQSAAAPTVPAVAAAPAVSAPPAT